MNTTKPGCLPKFIYRFLSSLNMGPALAVAPKDLPYRVRDDFLSPAEASFYRVLKQAVGEHLLVCPKVSLDDVFFVAHPEQNQVYWNKINRKHVDFLLCDPVSLKPVAGIELDDASHRRAERVERDAFVAQVFAAARLPLVRFPVQAGYAPQEIVLRLREALRAGGAVGAAAQASGEGKGEGAARMGQPGSRGNGTGESRATDSNAGGGDGAPLCPKCGRRMTLRTAQRGPQAGEKFYGCVNYPRCREVIAIDG